MTTQIKKPCKRAGCGQLVGVGAYCEKHRAEWEANAERKRVVSQRDQFRESAESRGYGADWRHARENFISRWPLCLGVLVPTDAWSESLAEKFGVLRDWERAQGRIVLVSREGVWLDPLAEFLARHPIYAWHSWDYGQAAAVIDHITPHRGKPSLRLSPWNFQPLTKSAHDRKTAKFDRAESHALGPYSVAKNADFTLA